MAAEASRTSSFRVGGGRNASIAVPGTRNISSSSLSTTPGQADGGTVPESAEETKKGKKKKRAKLPGKISSKGKFRVHPWDDNESELVISLRATGMSYTGMILADFSAWSYIGLRAKYLRLLDTPKWKERIRSMTEEMDDFERLEVVCEAQLAVAYSRLQRIQDGRHEKAQGNGRAPTGEGSGCADDNSVDDSTLEDIVEANKTLQAAQQKAQDKRTSPWSGEYVGKPKKQNTRPAPDERTTSQDERNVNGIENCKGDDQANESAAAVHNSAMDEDALEICETPDPEVARSTQVAETEPNVFSDSSVEDLNLIHHRKRMAAAA